MKKKQKKTHNYYFMAESTIMQQRLSPEDPTKIQTTKEKNQDWWLAD